MIVPDPKLSQELVDACPTCGNQQDPVVVDGEDSPLAAYRCPNGHVWMSQWEKSGYVKVGTLENYSQPTQPEPSSGYIASPELAQAAASPISVEEPKCISCGYPLASGHAPSCPYK